MIYNYEVKPSATQLCLGFAARTRADAAADGAGAVAHALALRHFVRFLTRTHLRVSNARGSPANACFWPCSSSLYPAARCQSRGEDRAEEITVASTRTCQCDTMLLIPRNQIRKPRAQVGAVTVCVRSALELSFIDDDKLI